MDVYSTLTRSKEDFKTINDNRVNLFVCGPTVYDDAHIGHGRTYISFDTIKRYLEFKGYAVFYIQNVTDIDDKIINRSKEAEFHQMFWHVNLRKDTVKTWQNLTSMA